MYYFAYGSNMSLDQMRRLCGWHFQVLGVGKLSDYEIGPDLRGYVNIRKNAGSHVLGVFYEVDQHSLDVLDDFEGYPNVFNRVEVEVEDFSKDKYNAWVYVESPEQFGASGVKEDYIKRVISGARENRLPEKWIKLLQSFPIS